MGGAALKKWWAVTYLRQMLVAGSLAVIRWAQRHGTRRPWLLKLVSRRTPKIAALALANKTACMVWAIRPAASVTTNRRWPPRNKSGDRRPRAWEGQSGM